MATSTSRPSHRPTHEESAQVDESIRQAAITTFLDRGYGGASMDAVAKAAGVTRKTLYSRYANKDDMFRSVMHWALREQADAGFSLDPTLDLRGTLLAIAEAAQERATSPETSRLTVLLMSEHERFPKLIPRSDQFGRYPFVQQLADVLERHQDSGEIPPLDVPVATEHFLAMVLSHPARLAALGMRRDPEKEHRYREGAVNVFLHGLRGLGPEED